MDQDMDMVLTSQSDDEEFMAFAALVEERENARGDTELGTDPHPDRDNNSDDDDTEPFALHRKRKSVRLQISDEDDEEERGQEQIGEVDNEVLASALFATEQSTAMVVDSITDTASGFAATSTEESDSDDHHQQSNDGSGSATSSSIGGSGGIRGFFEKTCGNAPGFDHHLARIQNEAASKNRKISKIVSTPKRPMPLQNKLKRARQTSSRSTSGNAFSDDEVESDGRSEYSNENPNTDKYTGEAQFVSIHRIRIQNPGSSQGSEEQIIQDIVTSYNKSHKSAADYLEKQVTKIPEIREEDRAHFQGDEFNIKIFVQRTIQKIGLLNAFGISEPSYSISALIFYYRRNEIFALTTNHAWTVVQSNSDYLFPRKIAARLLSEKGHLGKTSKRLFGNEVSSKKIMKKHEQSSPFAMLTLTPSFEADLRKDCSLKRLTSFRDSIITKIEIKLAGVRIKKRLDVCDFASVISHFSLIANNKPTFLFGTASLTPTQSPSTSTANQNVIREELDIDTHQSDLAEIPKEMNENLNLHLCGLLLEALRDPAKMSQLHNFNVGHKHYEDYASASKYILSRNSEECRVFYTMPSLKDIIDHVPIGKMQENAEKRREKNHTNLHTELLHEMSSIKLAFTNSKGAITSTSLINCLEGPLWWPHDGQVYWLVMTHWCVVRESYSLMVHTRFLQILRKGLLSERDHGYLHVPFVVDRVNQTEDPIRAYLRNFVGARLYFTWPDSDDVSESKLFDMLHVGQDDRIYLVYLTESVNSNLLSMGERIMRSNLKIQKACRNKKDSNVKDPVYCKLKSFYDGHLPHIRLHFKTFQEFVEGMQNSCVVYGMGRGEDTDTSLIQESELTTNISVADIEAVLQGKNKNRDLGKPIHEALQEHKYLESTGSITSKILICTQQTFSRDFQFRSFGQGVDTAFVFEEIMTKYRSKSGYNTFLLKNVFWMIDKDLTENGSEFFICELPRE